MSRSAVWTAGNIPSATGPSHTGTTCHKMSSTHHPSMRSRIDWTRCGQMWALKAEPLSSLLIKYQVSCKTRVMLNKLEWPSLEHRRKNQRLTTMFKIVQGLVAVPSSHLISADSRTRANHVYKFKNISASSTVYKNSFFPQWNSLIIIIIIISVSLL